MNIMKLTQAELASTTGSQMLKWLEKKSTTKSEYKRLYEDFKTIIIMQQAGFYEQADARLLQWKHLPMPVEYYTYRLAIASKAGGRRLAKKRFKALPEAIQKHDKLKQWRQAVNQNQWWMAATGVVAAGLLFVGIQAWSPTSENAAPKEETDQKIAQQLADLQTEVEQLKKENEKLNTDQKEKTEVEVKQEESPVKEKKTTKTSGLKPEAALKEAVAAVQAKDYQKANDLLSADVLKNKETAGMARFYKLIAAGKLKKTTQADYIAYREDFPKSGYMSDVLWMQAVYEQKYKKGDYRATLQELAQQPDNEWSYAAKAILSGKSTLGD
ncbi:hypothetical protein [Exiguobacterium indicum]|uniref:hypothetical protein n=1 Tax=Exiguobacterium indicum TaxID=296995 RepID=UPI00094FE761|nr:hypothetical protein [Exiguobacterium indicum]